MVGTSADVTVQTFAVMGGFQVVSRVSTNPQDKAVSCLGISYAVKSIGISYIFHMYWFRCCLTTSRQL